MGKLQPERVCAIQRTRGHAVDVVSGSSGDQRRKGNEILIRQIHKTVHRIHSELLLPETAGAGDHQ
jgi:hypothetical protein